MPTTFALPHLYAAVVARFAAEAAEDVDPVPNLFGWRSAEQKEVTGTRIAWVPGDPKGKLGELLAARKGAVSNPRPLANLGEIFHVVLNTADTTAPENELKQYEAARALFDAWYRAVHLAATVNLSIISVDWIIDKKVRRYGAAIVVVCSLAAPILDVAYETAPADTTAEIDVEELDQTETVTVPVPEPEEEEP